MLSPCSVMLLPACFSAYAFGSVRQILARTAIFYLGLVTTLVPLGVFASALGGLITTNRQTLISVVATLIIIAGLVLLSAPPPSHYPGADAVVTLEIADKVRIKISRSAVGSIIQKSGATAPKE